MQIDVCCEHPQQALFMIQNSSIKPIEQIKLNPPKNTEPACLETTSKKDSHESLLFWKEFVAVEPNSPKLVILRLIPTIPEWMGNLQHSLINIQYVIQ